MNNVPKTLLHVFIYPKPAKRIHRKVTMRERSVTGIPTLACSTKPIFIPYCFACSNVIRLAILPMIIRLPAKVLESYTRNKLEANFFRIFLNIQLAIVVSLQVNKKCQLWGSTFSLCFLLFTKCIFIKRLTMAPKSIIVLKNSIVA